MTWGDVKLIALQTMFSNEGAVITVDDINQEYINAMPGKANEAMQQITAVGRPILKDWHIKIADGADETVETDKLTLPAVEKRYKISLSFYLPRFRCIDRGTVMLDDGNIYDVAEDWSIEGDDVLVIPGNVTGEYTVWYRAYPQTITTQTPDEETIDMPPDAAALIPLYIAAELYKEDDWPWQRCCATSMRTACRNCRRHGQAGTVGLRAEPARYTTGWC